MSDADDTAMPSLLREARGAYALAIRQGLAEVGLGDLPANSAYLLGGLHYGINFEILERLRHRELERAGTLKALVAADCVTTGDEGVALTERGHDAAHACAVARERLDAHVAEQIGAAGMASMRQGLLALIEWKESQERG